MSLTPIPGSNAKYTPAPPQSRTGALIALFGEFMGGCNKEPMLHDYKRE